MGNGPVNNIDAGSNSSYFLHPFSGDHGQSLISGTDYISPVQGDKSGGSETSNSPIVGQKANGIALSDDVFEQNRNGLRADPSLASLPYIPSSFTGNFLDPLANKSVLSGLAGSSSHFDQILTNKCSQQYTQYLTKGLIKIRSNTD